MKPITNDHLPAFWDILIPGTTEWPCASEALGDTPVRLSPADEAWVREHATALTGIPSDRRTRTMQELERSEPGCFGRVLGALYEAYYTSAEGHAAVLRLAQSLPRETSASFDETLLQQVIATGAGRRRL